MYRNITRFFTIMLMNNELFFFETIKERRMHTFAIIKPNLSSIYVSLDMVQFWLTRRTKKVKMEVKVMVKVKLSLYKS